MAMTVEEQIKVQQAYIEGKKIQYKRFDSDNWEDTNAPIWNFAEYDYRVRTVYSDNTDTVKVLDVTNIKQFFEKYRGDKVADANNVLDQILPVLTANSYGHIVDWLHNNTQQLEASGFIKETAIDYEYMKENQPDLIQEILNTEPADPGNMTDEELEECARYWMNRASHSDIITVIKEEA